MLHLLLGSVSTKKKQLEYNHIDVLVRTESDTPSTSEESKMPMVLPKVSEEKPEEMIKEPEEMIKEDKNYELESPEPEIKETETVMQAEAVAIKAVPSETVQAKAVVAKPVAKPFATVAPTKSVEKVQFKPKLQFSGARSTKATVSTPLFKFGAKSTIATLKDGKDALVKPVNMTALPSTSTNTTAKVGLPAGSRSVMKPKTNREEMHKNLYKANKLCGDGRRTGMLKGVRLNKRFELQMAYRNMNMKKE